MLYLCTRKGLKNYEIMKSLYPILLSFVIVSCTKTNASSSKANITDSISDVNEISVPAAAPTHVSEISLPVGYSRVSIEDKTSFAYYLRHLPLKPLGTPVYTYDGHVSWTSDYAYAVIDSIDTGKDDLQQCADAVIRLRAEWLYAQKHYDDIAFHFTNGWLCDYKHWAEGNRVSVQGNRTSWYQAASRDYSYPTFRKYLNMVFNYAGTLSLSRELKFTNINDLQIGDVFIKGGSPGHAIIVIDVAENPETHDKAFMVAESYMPAQDIHILKNSIYGDHPWFYLRDFIDAQSCSFPSYFYDNLNYLKRF